MDFEALQRKSIFDFDGVKFPFRKLMAQAYDVDSGALEQVHQLGLQAAETEPNKDVRKAYADRFFQSVAFEQMHDLYKKFIVEELAPQFADDVIICQRRPSYHIQLPNLTAVINDPAGDPEKPCFHCDSQFNHPTSEINFWLPFTAAVPENTIYIESEPQKEDWHPIVLDYGQCLRFYGSKCRHYNTLNNQPGAQTRISWDFRLIPGSQWDGGVELVSLRTKTRFVIGEDGYYMVYDKRSGEFRYTLEAEETKENGADA